MAPLAQTISTARVGIRARLRLYWTLIKSPQTGLLLLTGFAGYASGVSDWRWPVVVGLTGSLFLAISGSTILNMWYDRDIDAVMGRTCERPLPAGRISPREALGLGLVLGLSGVVWALLMDPLYGLVVFAGLFFDVVVYTMWLKRRTCWSVVWGGIAGGMPILAARTLAVGQIEVIGLLLALAVLLWIPTHILTFSMRYYEDYQEAGVPTFPATYGYKTTRLIISVSAVLAALSLGLAAYGIGISAGYLHLMAVLSAGLFFLAATSTIRPSQKLNFSLFKYASLYMLCSMALIVVESL